MESVEGQERTARSHASDRPRKPKRSLTVAARALSVPFRNLKTRRWAVAVARESGRGDFAAAFTMAVRAAKAGDVDAQATVADMYLKGNGPPPSASSAAVWLEKAAQGGHVPAMAGLAKLHLAGHGPTTSLFGEKAQTDPGEALRWAETAAVAGLPEGKAILAFLLLREGGGKAASGKDARALLHEAAAADDPSASLQLAILSRQHDPVGDPHVVMPMLRHAAQCGLPMAKYLLGVAAETGFGCQQDEAAAVAYYRCAAGLGVVSAQVRYGAALLAGKHVSANPVMGETWLRRAAAAGDGRAAALAGDLRAGRDGLPPDFTGAGHWFLRAAELGDATSARILALLHLLGLGLPEDPRAAATWIGRAQTAKSAYLRDPAGLLVAGGLNLPLRISARRWFEAAAISGDYLAAYRLGVCLALGTDAEPDYKAGAHWFHVASKAVPAARLYYGQLLVAGYGIPGDIRAGSAVVREIPEAGVVEARSAMSGARAG